MRYYQLQISHQPLKANDNGKHIVAHTTQNHLFHIGSYHKRDPRNPMNRLIGTPYDEVNPAAPEIEFQINLNSPTSFDENGVGGTAVTVRYVDYLTTQRAQRFVGKVLRLQGGMGKGLPLSNPTQAGTILLGTVLSAVGNWTGTDQSITFYVQNYVSEPGSPEYPLKGWTPLHRQADNLQLHCQRGADLKTAIEQAIRAATGFYNIKFPSPNWKNPIPSPRDIAGTYATFSDLLRGLGNVWREYFEHTLHTRIRGETIEIYPDDYRPGPKKIKFEELIGQPAWNGVSEISFSCPMRADIVVGDVVELPANIGGTIEAQGADAIALPKNRLLFTGQFQVLRISHLGQLRSPDGQQWASTYTCAPV